jgi:Leucine-rich repeat (LRR) protein
MQRITSLHLEDCSLTAFPPEICKLRDLRILHIANNDLRQFPDAIGDLASLVELRARGISLCQLPETVGRLKKLEVLDLSCNKLEMLLPHSGLVQMTALERLDLSDNNIFLMPSDLSTLVSLKWLNVAHNRLDGLPEQWPPNLDFLDVYDNLLECLPASLPTATLRAFDVAKNPLAVNGFADVMSLDDYEVQAAQFIFRFIYPIFPRKSINKN